MDSVRLSFFGLLKNNFVKMQNVFRPFVVRELNCFEILFFRKNQKSPKKTDFFDFFLKTAETSLRRLKTPT